MQKCCISIFYVAHSHSTEADPEFTCCRRTMKALLQHQSDFLPAITLVEFFTFRR